MGSQTVTDLDRFTDDQLCQLHIDAGKRALTHFQNAERLIALIARMDDDDPDYIRMGQTYRTCMEVGAEAHELVLHIADVLRARRASADV